ncbi:MAG: hypothetical protein V4466_17060 [Pseudomonadota bacterium]
MRNAMIVSAFAVSALLTAAAGPAPRSAQTDPDTRSICVDVSGRTVPIACDGPASRLDRTEDFCRCRAGRLVEAPVCRGDERPPADNVAMDRARRAASQDGSLVGDSFEGRPMCISPRNP